MATEHERLVVVERALRSSVIQILQQVDDLSVAIDKLAARPRARRSSAEPASTSLGVRVDRHDFTVHWAGKSCRLGNTLSFRLMSQFVLRPNQYLSVTDLLDDVWKSARSPTAVRSAVSDLRARLVEARMKPLAACIDGRNAGHYGLIMPPR